MKLNTLEKLRDACATWNRASSFPADLMRRALVPLERMLAVK